MISITTWQRRAVPSCKEVCMNGRKVVCKVNRDRKGVFNRNKRLQLRWYLQDSPHIFNGTSDFATSYWCWQRVFGNTNLFIDIAVSKVVSTVSHSSDSHNNALIFWDWWQIFRKSNGGCIPWQWDLSCIRRQVIGDWIFDDTQEFFAAVNTSNAQLMQQLN